ncbi:MAG: hypothetical protein ACPG8W_06505 [Candidatus Promineifilaceae bacterium]
MINNLNDTMIKAGDVEIGWQNYHNLSLLAHSPLVDTVIYQKLCWEGDRDSPQIGRNVQIILQWAADELALSHVESKRENAVILRRRYIDHESLAKVAEPYGIRPSNVAQRQKTSVRQITQILNKELQSNHGEAKRLAALCQTRYAALGSDQQRTIGYLAIFEKAEPLVFLNQHKQYTVGSVLPAFLAANAVQQDADGEIRVHPRFLEYVRERLSSAEKQAHHSFVGYLYQGQQDFLQAATHWQQAEMWQEAAQMLIEHKAFLGEYEQDSAETLTQWQQLLAKFTRRRLKKNDEQWAQINLLIGNVAQLTKQPIEVALEAYGNALRWGKTTVTQAEIYFQRAHANQQKDVAQALYDVAQCCHLCEVHEDNEAITFCYIRAMLLQAWLLFAQKRDARSGRAWLEKAGEALETKSGKGWLSLRADWHNAWGEFYKYKQLCPERLQHCRHAVDTAYLANDPLRILKMTYQLGRVYTQCGPKYYAQAHREFEKSYRWATDTKNQYLKGAIQNAWGELVFFESSDFQKALAYYQRAYDIAGNAGDMLSLAAACFNATEALLELGDVEAAQKYMSEGEKKVSETGNQSLPKQFAYLRCKFPEVVNDLLPRQRDAIRFVRQHRQITKKQYQDLIQRSASMAARDLNDLVARKIFERHGKTRGIYYALASA